MANPAALPKNSETVPMAEGLTWLLLAQFAAGMADHALLIVALGVLIGHGSGFWWAPLLKIGFTAAYVVLAPWVGGWVDRGSKARWMVLTHLAKGAAVFGLVLGASPLLMFVIVGCAAATYAPARYGWITEVTHEKRLVTANAWLEVGLVGSALTGTVLGGLLLSPRWQSQVEQVLNVMPWPTFTAWSGYRPAEAAALQVLLLLYLLAAAVNTWVPPSGWRPHHAPKRVGFRSTVRDFWQSNLRLWQDQQGGRLSLAATSVFWGVGAALQMIVLQWATTRLALPLHQAAYLQGAVAIGMVAGAAAAGRWMTLAHAPRLLPVGIALGILVPVASLTTDVQMAALFLGLAGAAGGFTVIPLNALLQWRGMQLLTPGRSMAVQAFNENSSILLMLGCYALLAKWQVSATAVMWILGTMVTASLALLMRWVPSPRDADSP